MGVAYNPRVVTDGLVACYDIGNVFRNTSTYTVTNFLQNGSFSGGLGVTYEAGSNPTNTIIELENPGESQYVLRQNGNNTEYQMNIDGGAQGTLSANTQYVMSGWYAKSSDYNGGDTMFHARAYSSSGANTYTGTGIGTLLYSVELGGLTWEYRYQTITTPSDYSGDFDWYMGYGTTNTTGYRYYTGLRVQEGSFPSLVDLSKNDVDATVRNGTSFTNSNGGYINFDGIDDYIGIGKTSGDLGIYDGDYTFEAWVYPTDISALSGDNFIFGTTQASLRQGLHLGFRNTNIYQGHYSADYNSGTVTANQWYHIVWTYEKNLGATNGTAKIYKNGQLQPNPATISSWIGTTEILIGNALTASGRHFQGRGAQFKIYNRAITSSEVKQNFDAQKVRYGTFDPEPTIVTNGLVLNLDAANKNSYPGYGDTWYDLSGFDRDATLFNNVQYDPDLSGSLDFNRTNDSYATIPHDATISSEVFGTSNNFTLSAWFVVDQYVSYSCFIQKAFAGSYSNTTAGLWSEATNRLKFVMGTNEGGNPSGSNLQITYNATPGVWYNMVGVADGTTARLYINGNQVGTATISSVLTRPRSENGSAITIGTRSTNNTPELDGRISNVSVYNRGLSAAEVLQNYNALKGRYIDHKATVIEDNLLLYLDAANNDSYPDTGTTWTDLSGNGCNGTLQGGVGYSSDNGGVLTFDGVDDYVPLVDNFGNPQRFTVDFWCYPTALNVDSNNNYRRILTAEGVNANFILIEQSGLISFRVPGGSPDNFTASGFTGVNQWGHVVCTYDQGYRRIYFNGSLVGQREEIGATVNFGTPQIVSPSNIQTFEGRIANFRIYDRALNAKEVEKNFNILRGRFGI